MGKHIGIDLGTTFSCMAYIDDDGQARMIPNSEGENVTPSTVLFEDGNAIVGKEAKAQSLCSPHNFEQFVKRHMGERDYFFTSEDGKKYSPEAVSGIILSKLKADAEMYLGDSVDGAVITVPAYFNEAQRKSTMDAGKIAGLNVTGIINEPTAAALAFGITKGTDKSQVVMVYDLGGGTFDVTVIRFDSQNITVLGTSGDRKLGGCDFDSKIIEAVCAAASEQSLDVATDPTARQDLQLKAEMAKKSLSSKEKTNIVLNIQGQPFKYNLTREDFIDMVEPVLLKTMGSMENAIDSAGLSYTDIDKILLVGGSTRMPVVTSCIEEETGIVPSAEVHPDEAVAIGAAFHALDVLKEMQETAKATGDSDNKVLETVVPETTRQYNFTDVTSHGIGVIVRGEGDRSENSVILPSNVQVPASATNTYSTSRPYQEKLKIQITQGDETDLRYVTEIGSAVIEVAPREKIVPVEVTIACDENSIIHVRVFDLDLQQDLGEMHIDRISNLSDSEVDESYALISSMDISGD
ncbi:MAG: Hsp70 family protein [Eubacteriales bacterium]